MEITDEFFILSLCALTARTNLIMSLVMGVLELQLSHSTETERLTEANKLGVPLFTSPSAYWL